MATDFCFQCCCRTNRTLCTRSAPGKERIPCNPETNQHQYACVQYSQAPATQDSMHLAFCASPFAGLTRDEYASLVHADQGKIARCVPAATGPFTREVQLLALIILRLLLTDILAFLFADALTVVVALTQVWVGVTVVAECVRCHLCHQLSMVSVCGLKPSAKQSEQPVGTIQTWGFCFFLLFSTSYVSPALSAHPPMTMSVLGYGRGLLAGPMILQIGRTSRQMVAETEMKKKDW